MKGLSGITAEQQLLLKSNNHSLQLLKTSGRLNIWQMFEMASLPLLVFVFTLLCSVSSLRFENEWLVHWVLWMGVTLLLAIPTITVLVLSFSVLSTKLYSKVRWPSAVYWGYWPCWRFLLCWAAFGIAHHFGNSTWYQEVLPNIQMSRLQSYHAIDPITARGPRLQDAGVVVFNASAGVDRAQTGCLKNGAIYCVAPIVAGNELAPANGTVHNPAPRDLFMAGKDCCECPGEFRCGDWNRPARQIGGMRIMDPSDTAFYRLAVEEWSSKYGQSVKQPIFFEWVDEPFDAWTDMEIRGQRIWVGLLIFAPVVIMTLIHLLNLVFGLLQSEGRASPIDPPMPQPGFGIGQAVSKRLLPQMHRDQEERERQQGFGHSTGPGPVQYAML